MRLRSRVGVSGMKFVYLVGFLAVLVFMGSLAGNLVDLLGQGGRIEEAQEEVALLEEENRELEELVEGAESEEFEERQIREKLGLVAPGEAVVMLPEDLGVMEVKERSELEEEGANWEEWLGLFL